MLFVIQMLLENMGIPRGEALPHCACLGGDQRWRPVSAPAVNASNFVDPSALMAIRNLELRAKTVVEGFWHGLHRSPYHGFSVEFTEYRPYTTGDDPRYLDWKLVGRTDRYF